MIHHIEIYVSQLTATKKLYRFLLTELGYHLYQEWEQGFSYKLEDHYIVFVQTEENYRSNGYHRKNTGLNHLAFIVSDRQAVDHLRQKLLDHAVSELYSDAYPFAGGPNHYAFYFEDPDRIKLEIVTKDPQ
ncbi:VOC family protein [Enterococcus olivae]